MIRSTLFEGGLSLSFANIDERLPLIFEKSEAFKFDVKNEIHIIREALVGKLNGITNA